MSSAPADAKSYVEPAIPFTFDAVPDVVNWLAPYAERTHGFLEKRQIRFLRVGEGVRYSYKEEASVEVWRDWDDRDGERPLLRSVPTTPLTMCYFSAAPAVLCLGRKPPKAEAEERKALAASEATAHAIELDDELPLNPRMLAEVEDDMAIRDSLPGARVKGTKRKRRTAEEKRTEAEAAAAQIENARKLLCATSKDVNDVYGDDEPSSYNRDPMYLSYLQPDGTLRSWDENGKTFSSFMAKLDEITITSAAGEHPRPPADGDNHLISQRGADSIKAFVNKLLRPYKIDVRNFLLIVYF